MTRASHHSTCLTRPTSMAAAISTGLLTLISPMTQAVTTDISSQPVAVGMPTPPNIMFILDDSGSMGWDHMPDNLDDNNNTTDQYGFWSSQCNGVAFNPTVTYISPVKPDGTLYPDVLFTAAPSDGFNPTTGRTTDLTNNYYYQYNGTEIPLAWTYSSNGQVDRTTTFYKECMSSISGQSVPGVNVFTKISLNSPTISAATKQNYANWHSYYRTRKLTMRTSAGRAFQRLNSDVRIGFTVISDKGVAGAKFLDVGAFTNIQKDSFFNLLYTAGTGGMTPIRGALSKVGRYFAYSVSGQSVDPITYSCQRNYAILSTDGYWNTGSEVSDSGAALNYGPYQLDNLTRVGQQDGTQPRPMKDSADGATGSSDSLADVAQYYWATDLRPDHINDIASIPGDIADYQHLNTFTIGLGLKGTLNYSRDYLTNPASSDYEALRSGTKNWPIPSRTNLNGGTEDATHIDDLWHAAVNGRGQYFSAANSSDLVSALVASLDAISSQTSTGAAASTSAQTPVQADRWVFVGNYTSKSWVGDVRAYQFGFDANGNLTAPDTKATKPIWSAASELDKRNLATSPRRILFNSADALKTLVDFNTTNLAKVSSGTGTLASHFENRCGLPNSRPATELLSQCELLRMMSGDLRNKVTGDNLVNYLAGDKTYYLDSATASNQLFRSRTSRLGDIVNAAPVHVGKPPFQYVDAGYAAFVAAQANRTKVVYAAANDGMLHAFKVGVDGNTDGTGGTELWAFVPTPVIPEMWRLADDNYKANHRYFVDATPVVADVYDGGKWRTILVGGLGAGGRGYYALDVTVPESPLLLWEFSSSDDASLGLTLGQPIVTKKADGTWVVVLTSGANNNATPDNPGVGRVYVLNAVTGARIGIALTTCTAGGVCSGSADTPNNLLHLNAWTNSPTDNTTLRYYGGDMLGNLWRFDIEKPETVLLGTAVSPAGAVQPITTKPVLTEIKPHGSPITLVSFGTGRLLGNSDLSDTTVQTIYTIRDALGSTGLGQLRTSTTAASAAGLVEQKLDPATRLVATVNAVDWSNTAVNGWFVDLNVQAASGERVIVNGLSTRGILGMASMIPSVQHCQSSGTSWLYQFDITSGQVLGATYFSAIVTGIGVVRQENTAAGESSGGPSASSLFATTSGGETKLETIRGGGPPPPGAVKRTSWRELVD